MRPELAAIVPGGDRANAGTTRSRDARAHCSAIDCLIEPVQHDLEYGVYVVGQ